MGKKNLAEFVLFIVTVSPQTIKARVSKTRSGAYFSQVYKKGPYYQDIKELRLVHHRIYSEEPQINTRTRVSKIFSKCLPHTVTKLCYLGCGRK